MASMNTGVRQTPTQPERARWPWVAFAGFVVTFATGIVFHLLNGQSIATAIPFVLPFTMFAVVGVLVVTRDPHNRIGLLLLLGSLIMAACSAAGDFATWALEQNYQGPVVAITGLISNFGWLLGLLAPLLLIPVLFPDGHPPSPRWRPFIWACGAFLAIIGLNLLFGQRLLGGSGDDVGVPNPLFIPALGNVTLDPIIAVLLPILFGLSVFSLVQRFRRSSGVERQQIKWVAFGLPVAVVSFVISIVAGDGTIVGSIFSAASYLVFPATIGIAILRFHLYDLDVVVRKTLVYGALAAFITAVYVAIVVGVGTLVGSGDSQNLALSIAATAIVAVAFQPVRSRAERLANRVVYGERATPYEVLASFSGRMGEAYDDDDVLQRMSRVLGEGIAAEHAEVWLHVGDELRAAAVWPGGIEQPRAIPIVTGELPNLPDVDAVYPVNDQGELLGALSVTKPSSDPLTPADRALTADLADQAGLVLRNVRLTEDLRARLDDLKAAQSRIVRAQDEERRKLERNIHDGAQQQLVALTVKARLAEQMLERDPSSARSLIKQIRLETTEALEDLRDLAHGIYPPLLADRGLAEALAAQARKAAVSVEVRSDGLGRYPQEIEGAVYFCCLEALQNVAKYANATRAVVRLSDDGPVFMFEVVDDGDGFDPDQTPLGSGLQGMRDRLDALGGSLIVRSARGSGTSVTGTVPYALGPDDARTLVTVDSGP